VQEILDAILAENYEADMFAGLPAREKNTPCRAPATALAGVSRQACPPPVVVDERAQFGAVWASSGLDVAGEHLGLLDVDVGVECD
jgi:hypothetical protein